MKAALFRKGPNDRKKYTIEYNDWLDVAELLTAVTAAGPASPDTFVVDGYVLSTDKKDIIFYVSGGTVGLSYDVTITAYTSLGQIKQDIVTFKVI